MTTKRPRPAKSAMFRRPGMRLVLDTLIDLGRLAYFRKHGRL